MLLDGTEAGAGLGSDQLEGPAESPGVRVDRGGEPVALAAASVGRAGDRLWVCAPDGPVLARLFHAVLDGVAVGAAMVGSYLRTVGGVGVHGTLLFGGAIANHTHFRWALAGACASPAACHEEVRAAPR